MIEESDPVFKMAELLGELDYRELRGTYRRRWRSISPEIMFSIVVYANMKGIYSSRGIEEACRTDIRFMWLLQYRKAPDHTTISRFLENNMSGCAEDLFYQLIEKLAEMGEIDFKALFVDGTKIEANANSYTFVWVKAVEKRLKKQDYGFRRFLTRGKKNNETRLFILAVAFNIQKLCSRIANGRFGKSLFELKTA